MANHYTADEVAPNIYERRLHVSVQRPTPEMLAGVPQWPHPAQYAAKVDGAFVALPDDALDVWTAQQEAAAFAVVAAKALPIVKQLRGLLAAFGMVIPTTEVEATEAIALMELTGEQVAALGALGVTWQAVQAMGIADHLEAILATEEAAQ